MKFGGSDDNYVVIGAKVDTKGVEKGIAEIERQTEKIKDIKVNVDVSVADIIDEDTFKQLGDLLNRYKELTSGEVLFESDRKEAEGIKNEILGIVNYIEKLTGEHLIIKGINDVDNTLPKIKSKISQMGNSLERIGKRVSGIGLRLLGLKTLFNAVSSSINYLKSDNKQLKNSLDRIQAIIDAVVERIVMALLPTIQRITPIIERIANIILNVLMGAIEKILPILEAILNILGEFIVYIGNAVGKLLGIDTSAKNLAVSLRKSNKEAKALKKQLAGFDEMTILNKDGSTGAIGGLGTSGTSGNKNNDKKAEKVAEGFIEEHADEFLTGTAALIGLKAGGLTGGTIASGIANFIEQIVDIGNVIDDPNAENVYELFKDANPQIRIGDELQEIFEKTGIMDKDNPLWLTSLPALWKGIGKTFIQLITGELDGAEEVVKDGGQSINHATEQVINQINDTLDTNLRKPIFTDLLKKGVKTARETIEGAIVTYEDGLYTIKTKTGQTFTVTKEEFEMYKNTVFKGVKVFSSEAERASNDIQNQVIATTSISKKEVKKVQEDTKETVDIIKDNVLSSMSVFTDEGEQTALNLKNNVETISSMTQKEVDAVNKKVKSSNTTIVKSVNDSIDALKDLGKTPIKEVGEGAVNVAGGIKNQVDEIIKKGLPKSVKEGLEQAKKNVKDFDAVAPTLTNNLREVGTTAGTSVGKGIANGVNSALSKIEGNLNATVTTINQLMSNMGNSAIMGAYAISGQVNKLSKIKLPRVKLAKGGIINSPGRGVAVGGERGAEWVQPLTDEQSLDKVANAIGRRIVLQPTIPVYVGNRLVAREVRNINAQDEFAFNGGL